MKRFAVLLSLFAVFFLTTSSFAIDESTISKNVDKLVTELNAGVDMTSLHMDKLTPYAFVMQPDGKMLIHPTLAGKSLKTEAPVVYAELLKASPEGVWVTYQWQGKVKHTYAKRTGNNLIVGSGY